MNINQIRIGMIAEKQRGTKFADGGRDRYGLDQMGLIAYCLKAGSGIEFGDDLQKELERLCVKVDPKSATDGDIVLLAYNSTTRHAGIYYAGKILQASSKYGSVIETRFKVSLNSDLCAVYRLRAFIDEQ